ncbi:MAG: O-antigen ligase family protein, partial [Candidatus Komeilibacteria bacterium]|nr:O-antigen ligase family protein [Candidatus Komeilibacteria bacterium]
MNKLSKIIKVVLIATLVLPLIYNKWTIYPSHFGKTVFFQIIIACLLIGAYYYLVLKQKQYIKLRLLDYLLLLFVGLSLLSSILGVEWNRSFWGDQSRVQGVFTLIHFTAFYFLVRQFFISHKDWHKALVAVCLVGVLSSLVAWLGPVLPWLNNFVPSDPRLNGLIGNPIFFANYLQLLIFLSLFSHFYFKEKSWCWLWLFAAVIIFITLLGTQTRGPLVGLVVGIAVFLVLFILTQTNRQIKFGAVIIGLVVAGFLTAGYTIPSVRQVVPDRLQFIFAISPDEGTAQTRLMAWQIAIDGWKEHPYLGVGPESYQDTFDHHYNPNFLQFSFAETVWDQPHNYALEILSSRGAIGLASYLAIIIAALAYLYQAWKRESDKSKRLAFIFLLSGLAAYVSQLMFSFETSNSWQLWFLFLGLIAWLRYGQETSVINRACLGRKIGLVILGVLAVTSVYYNILMLKSTYYTSYARDAAAIQSVYLWQQYAVKAIEAPVPFQWEQAFFLTKDMAILDGYRKLDKQALIAVGPQIEKVWLKYIAQKPDTFLYKFWLSQLYAFMGEFVDVGYFPKSEKLLVEAWNINKSRQTVPLLLSKTYFIEGKVDESIKVMEELVAQNPVYEQPHWFLGLNLMSAGQTERGLVELEKGKNFGLGFQSNIQYLIDVYAQERQYEKIPELYELLITREPDNYGYYANLAATYAVLGNKPKALEYIKKAVDLNPSLQAEA